MNTLFLDFTVYQCPDLENFNENLSGKNNRHVLIAFLDEQQQELLDFLKKVTTAAKLQLENDCLLLASPSSSKQLPSFSQIKQQYDIKQALFFGINPKELGLNINLTPYIPTSFNQCTYLFIDRLSNIERSPERKKALWHGLQTMFLNV